MDTSDVVVIIPCYNAAAFLNGAVDSVLQQTHPISAVIVVDDASTDGSVAIVDAYAARGYPVRCMTLASNSGPATARNEGIAHSTEPFVAFLDADDRWSNNHCASLLTLLLEHPEADLAFSQCRSTDPRMPDSVLPVAAAQPLDMLEELLDDSFIPQSAVVARRARVDAVGGYVGGMRYSEDYDLWLRMAHGRKFIASPESTCVRTSHPGQVTRDDAKMSRGAWEARARYSEFAARHGSAVPANRYRAICERAYNRDLADAWGSRSLMVLLSVLKFSTIVPGGERIRRRWMWRIVTVWPLWRLAAFFWDALPAPLRHRLRASRVR